MNVPEEILAPDNIDNDGVEEEELLNDLVKTNGNNQSLIPEGIELGGEEKQDNE